MAFAADVVLALHALFVAFVVVGQVCILIGWACGWRWVRNPWFRFVHIGTIGFVMLEAWFGIPCPLTVLENALRVAADGTPYATGFIGHWLQRAIFYDAPPRVFTAVYTVFFAVVVASLVGYPPRRRRSL